MLHPKYLDPQGLVALWRESLLAQKVLQGATRGDRAHPQLTRFRAHEDPVAAISAYLRPIHAGASNRGSRLDAQKIAPHGDAPVMEGAAGQLQYEWEHLLRSPKNAERLLRALGRALERSETPQNLADLRHEIGLGESA